MRFFVEKKTGKLGCAGKSFIKIRYIIYSYVKNNGITETHKKENK